MAPDEPNSNEAFEQLATMYLTDFNPPSVDPQPTPTGSHLRLAGTDEPGAADPGAAAPTDDDTMPRGRSDDALAIEGVLVGHLPGFANLWLGQYAQRLAASRGAVAVVLADETSIELELYGSAATGPLPPALAEAPDRSLEQVLAALAELSAVWLVRLPSEADAAAQHVAEAVDAWTLLTGSNDAAVVQAYRLIKQYADGCDHRTPHGQVQLMMCGCDAPEGEHAADRLARTTSQYLRLTPTLVGVQRRMEPIRKKRLGAFDVDEPWTLLADLLRASPAQETELAPDAAAAAAATAPDEHDVVDLSDLEIAEGDLLDDEEFAALEHDAVDEPATDEARVDAVDPPAEPGANGLTQYLPGVEAIEARCPSHEAIELGIDDSGALQLLARADGDPRAALQQAYDTRAWAAEHAKLLRLTCPSLDLDTDREPTVHLFTDQPKSLGELAYRGKPGSRPIRLHLLVPVTVGETTTWTHVELN